MKGFEKRGFNGVCKNNTVYVRRSENECKKTRVEDSTMKVSVRQGSTGF